MRGTAEQACIKAATAEKSAFCCLPWVGPLGLQDHYWTANVLSCNGMGSMLLSWGPCVRLGKHRAWL